MYAIAMVAAVDDDMSAPGLDSFYPDVTTNGEQYSGYSECIMAPTVPGGRNTKAKNWCICKLDDPANATGPNLFKITEDIDTTWGSISPARQNQILNVLGAWGIDSSFIADGDTISKIIEKISKELKEGYVVSAQSRRRG